MANLEAVCPAIGEPCKDLQALLRTKGSLRTYLDIDTAPGQRAPLHGGAAGFMALASISIRPLRTIQEAVTTEDDKIANIRRKGTNVQKIAVGALYDAEALACMNLTCTDGNCQIAAALETPQYRDLRQLIERKDD